MKFLNIFGNAEYVNLESKFYLILLVWFYIKKTSTVLGSDGRREFEMHFWNRFTTGSKAIVLPLI